MDLLSIYEIAARKKFRFPYKGMIGLEDLWDLNVKALDQIFKSLNAIAKTEQEESLLTAKDYADSEVDMKIQLIRHIVQTKLAEEAAREHEKARADQRQKIMEIMDNKREEKLRNLSEVELQAMLDQL